MKKSGRYQKKPPRTVDELHKQFLELKVLRAKVAKAR